MIDKSEGTQVSSKSYVSVEILITTLSFAVALAIMWSNISSGLRKNASDIETVRGQISVLSSELKSINSTLSEMLVAQRVQNELAKVKMADRWTAAMEEENNRATFELLRRLHPELKATDHTDIRLIQRKYGHSAEE